jgi:hypothetical protein
MLEMECKSEEEAKKSEWRGGNLKHLDSIRGKFQNSFFQMAGLEKL